MMRIKNRLEFYNYRNWIMKWVNKYRSKMTNFYNAIRIEKDYNNKTMLIKIKLIIYKLQSMN